MASSGGLIVDESRMRDSRIHDETQGLEATPAEYSSGTYASAPQIIPGAEKQVIGVQDEYAGTQQIDIYSDYKQPDRQPAGHRRSRKFWILLALVLALIIIVAIAIAVPLARKSRGRSASPADRNYTTSGALNGTRFASFNQKVNFETVTDLFYQDFETRIRRARKAGVDPTYTWSLGAQSDPIELPSPAKNATPMAGLNYTDSRTNIATAHLFYLNQSNFLHEVISTDDLATWRPGPLGDAGIEASSNSIALAAAFSETLFGTVRNSSAGLRLYYGDVNGLVSELAYTYDDVTEWTKQSTFERTKGDAGIAIQASDFDIYVSNLFVINTMNQLQIWSGNFYRKARDSFPGFGSWSEVQETLSYDIAENSSLAIALNHITFQDVNNVFQTAHAEPRLGTVWSDEIIQFPSNGTNLGSLPQSGMAASSIWLGPGQSGAHSLDVFLQVNGSTLMDCLNKMAAFNCKKIPNI